MYDVWAAMPQYVNGRRPWSLVASGIAEEHVDAYRSTFLLPLHIEASTGPGPKQPYHQAADARGMA